MQENNDAPAGQIGQTVQETRPQPIEAQKTPDEATGAPETNVKAQPGQDHPVTRAIKQPLLKGDKKTTLDKLLGLMKLFVALLSGALIGSLIGGGVGPMTLGFMPVSIFVLIVGGVILAVIGWILGVATIIGYAAWRVPEAFLYHTIRNGHYLLFRHVTPSGREMHYPGRISDDGTSIEVRVHGHWFNAAVSPDLLGEGKNSFFNGIEVVDCMTNNSVLYGPQDAMSLFTLQEHYKNPKNQYQKLPFLEDGIVYYLYSCPESELDGNCAQYISVAPSSITLDMLDKSKIPDRTTNETDEDYRKRIKPIVDQLYKEVYLAVANVELDTLKNEVLRLKRESKDFVIVSRIFVRHAAARAMNISLAKDAKDTIERIARNKQNRKEKWELPGWGKTAIVILVVCVGLAIVMLAAKQLIPGV